MIPKTENLVVVRSRGSKTRWPVGLHLESYREGRKPEKQGFVLTKEEALEVAQNLMRAVVLSEMGLLGGDVVKIPEDPVDDEQTE